jgi:hypothetical protein
VFSLAQTVEEWPYLLAVATRLGWSWIGSDHNLSAGTPGVGAAAGPDVAARLEAPKRPVGLPPPSRRRACKPDILVMMADKLAGTLFPDGPAPFLYGPNLGWLAKCSARFNATYCESPLCAPSRAAVQRFGKRNVN